MTRNIRSLYLARSEAEGHPAILLDYERKEGEDEDMFISPKPMRSIGNWALDSFLQISGHNRVKECEQQR
jgi:hypothetical protein